MPAMNAISRKHEREADRYAWENIAGIEPFITSMQKLADQNLAERTPNKFVEWLFHSHPSIGRSELPRRKDVGQKTRPSGQDLRARPNRFRSGASHLPPPGAGPLPCPRPRYRRASRRRRSSTPLSRKRSCSSRSLRSSVRLGPLHERVQRRLAIGIEAEVLVVADAAGRHRDQTEWLRARSTAPVRRVASRLLPHWDCRGLPRAQGVFSVPTCTSTLLHQCEQSVQMCSRRASGSSP